MRFEPAGSGGYHLTGETRVGPLFECCGDVRGAEEAVSTLRTGLHILIKRVSALCSN
jgi:hypothetical protein